MNDLRRLLERSAAGFQPPADWLRRIEDRRRRKRKNERLAATAVGMLVCGLILVGMAALTGDSRAPSPAISDARSPSSALPSEAASLFRPVYLDTFGPGETEWPRWPTEQRRTHTFGYAAGAYAVRVLDPFDNRYWIRQVIDPYPGVAVRVQIDRASSGTSGWAGVMCPYSLSPDDGYAFVLAGSGGDWRILSVVEDQPPIVLGEGTMASIEPGGVATNVVRGRCELVSPGRAKLTIQVGDESASVIDEAGPDGFIGIGMYVQADAGKGVARFDDLLLEAKDRCDSGQSLLLGPSVLGRGSPIRSVTCM